MFLRSTRRPWTQSGPFVLLCYLAVLVGVGACSQPEKVPAAQEPPAGEATQAFLLQEIYSGRYCFRPRFYWRDSARNVREVCQVRRQVQDSVNRVRVELHWWQGEHCDTNEFWVVRQANRAWFVPFCDAMTLRGRGPQDTTFAKTELALTRPLNAALQGLALRNRHAFLDRLLNGVFSGSEQHVTRANYATLVDSTLRGYLRPRLDTPRLWYFRVERLPGLGSQTSPVWEFDDTHPNGLRVRVLRPTWYECISM